MATEVDQTAEQTAARTPGSEHADLGIAWPGRIDDVGVALTGVGIHPAVRHSETSVEAGLMFPSAADRELRLLALAVRLADRADRLAGGPIQIQRIRVRRELVDQRLHEVRRLRERRGFVPTERATAMGVRRRQHDLRARDAGAALDLAPYRIAPVVRERKIAGVDADEGQRRVLLLQHRRANLQRIVNLFRIALPVAARDFHPQRRRHIGNRKSGSHNRLSSPPVGYFFAAKIWSARRWASSSAVLTSVLPV
jgi:hypothetical protein